MIFGLSFKLTETGLSIVSNGLTSEISYRNLSIYIVVAGICIGVLAGLYISVYTRKKQHRIVKSLLSQNCKKKEDAKTLSELGLKHNCSKLLKEGKQLRKCVLLANPSECETKKEKTAIYKIFSRDPETKTDYEKARFYIPEENITAAETRFEEEKIRLPGILAATVAIIGIAVAIIILLPTYLDNWNASFNQGLHGGNN